MPFVIAIFLLAAAVWAAAFLRTNAADRLMRLRPLPMLGMAVVLTGSVFGYDFFHISSGPVPITIDRLLFGGMLALAGWFWLTNREDLRPINRMDMSMLAVMGFLLYSTITHDFKFEGNMPLSRLLFFNLIPLGVYAVMRTAKMGDKELKAITFAFGAFAIYLSLTGVAEMKQFYAVVFPKFIVNSETVEFLGRGRGPFLNPVSNGVFQIYGLCCIWFWWPKADLRLRILIMALTLVVAAGVYATLTRSVWLSLIVVGGIVVFYPSPQSQKGIMVVAACLFFIAAFPVIGDKLTSFKRDKDVTEAEMSESAQLRPLFLVVAMRMFQDRPLLGCGFGQYAREKYPYLQDPYTGRQLSKTKTYYQHNVFLAYLTETGLIGMSLLLLMLTMMARMAWHLWINLNRTLCQRQFALLMAAVLTCYSINGMFHDTSIIPLLNMLLFFTAGIVNNIETVSRVNESVPSATRPTRAPMHPSEAHGFPATNS